MKQGCPCPSLIAARASGGRSLATRRRAPRAGECVFRSTRCPFRAVPDRCSDGPDHGSERSDEDVVSGWVRVVVAGRTRSLIPASPERRRRCPNAVPDDPIVVPEHPITRRKVRSGPRRGRDRGPRQPGEHPQRTSPGAANPRTIAIWFSRMSGEIEYETRKQRIDPKLDWAGWRLHGRDARRTG